MQKDLLKLALTGLITGLSVSGHAGSEIAMTKCTKSPPPKQQPQDMDDEQNGESSFGSSSETGVCGSSGESGSCGSQGDQSQNNEAVTAPQVLSKLEIRRLGAAKAMVYEEEVRNMDK